MEETETKKAEFITSIPPQQGMNQKDWIEQYSKLTIEERACLEAQHQTRHLDRISKNVAFFAWILIVSFGAVALYFLMKVAFA